MDQRTLEFVLQFKNETDAAIKAMQADLQKLTGALGKTNDATEKTNKGVAKLDDGFKKLAATAAGALAAFGLVQGIQTSVKTIADFEQAMSTVQAVTQATTTGMTQLRDVAKELGSTTRFTATQAAEGMILLGQAGFSTNEILQSIRPTLNLAQAGGLGLAQAAEVASGTLRGFGLEVGETARVMDVLAKAAIASNADVSTLGEGLKYAAPTARALGLGLEETVATLSKLADANIKGGQGGRGFQSFVTALVQSKKEIERLIGPFNAAQEGLSSVIRRLVEAGITTQQVIDIFRAENLDVFTILAGAATDAANGTDQLEKALRDAGGTSEEVARIMDDNLNGAILGAQSAMEGFVIAIGEAGITDILRGTLEQLSKAFTFFKTILNEVTLATHDASGELNTLGKIMQFVFKAAGVVAGIIAMDLAIKGLTWAMGKATIAAATMWKTVTGPIGLISVGFGVASLAVETLYANFKEVRDVVDSTFGFVKNLLVGLGQLAGVIPTNEQAAFNEEMASAKSIAAEYKQTLEQLTTAHEDERAAILETAEAQKIASRNKIATLRQDLQEQQRIVREAKAEADRLATLPGVTPQGAGVIASAAIEQYKEAQRQVESLMQTIDEMEQTIARGEGIAGLAEWNRQLKLAKENAKKAGEDQKKLDKEQQDALDSAVNGLKAKLREAQHNLEIVGLEGKELAKVQATYEFTEALKKTGLLSQETINAAVKQYADTLDKIAATEDERRQNTEDKKILDKINSEKKAYDDLKASLDRLLQAQKISAEDVTAALQNTDLRSSERDLLGQLGPEEAKRAAELKAKAEYDTRIAQAKRLATDLGYTEKQAADLQLAVQRQYEQDLTQIKIDAETARQNLLKQLQVGAEYNPEATQLQRDLAQIQSETQSKLQLLETQKNLFLGKEEEYQRLRQAIIDRGNKLKEQAEAASFRTSLASMSSGLGQLSDALKEGLGENNAIYKAAFVASKAFAIASSIVNIQKAISEAAASGPFPANLAAMATVAAETASIISTITATKLALADGGRVRGKGGPRDDKIPAWLSNGEFVVNAEATSKFLPLLEAINQGRTPKFAAGGQIAAASFSSASAYRGTPAIGNSLTFAPQITVQASGNRQTDERLVDDLDTRMRRIWMEMAREQQRVGGVFAQAGR